MSLPLASLPAVPLSGGRYVAAAYIVAFVVILAYLAIMAVRAQRLERDLDALRRDVEAARAGARDPTEDGDGDGTMMAAGDRRSM